MDGRIGTYLGKYQLEERLGAGGFGVVYRAQHPQLGLPRAIKILKLDGVDPASASRLLQEARLAASLHHPNIVQIYDVDTQDGTPYVVMEFLPGQSLRQVVEANPKGLPFDRAVRLLSQLADALDFAHQHQVVHRDVKPDNAFVGPDDRLTVVDFGLGRARDSGGASSAGPMGTIPYVAPELLSLWDKEDHFKLGVSSDGYALGIVAYEFLTGQVPFRGSVEAVLHAHAFTPPPPPRQRRPDLPVAAERVLLKQLAKVPAQRYASGREFVAALGAALGEKGTRPPGPKVPWLPVGAVAALVLLWVLIGMPTPWNGGGGDNGTDTPVPDSTIVPSPSTGGTSFGGATPAASATPAGGGSDQPTPAPTVVQPATLGPVRTLGPVANGGANPCPQSKIQVVQGPVQTAADGSRSQVLTVSNNCSTAQSFALDADEKNAQTGDLSDVATFQILDLAPGGSDPVHYPLRPGDAVDHWLVTWFAAGQTGPGCWNLIDGSQTLCLRVAPWLEDAVLALSDSSTGEALLQETARAGLILDLGHPPGNAMGSYSPLLHTVTLDAGMTTATQGAEPTSARARAAILAHWLQHALTQGNALFVAPAACQAAETSSFATEGKVWSQLWSNQLPHNVNALDAQLNRVAIQYGSTSGSPSTNAATFAASLQFKYGDECAPAAGS